jgi:hypothetical protein
VDLEVVGVDGMAQVVFEPDAIELARVHVGVEQLVAGLAARLRVIHRRVGIAHDVVGILVLGVSARNADAGRGHDFAAADRERRAERGLNAKRDCVGLVDVAELVQQDRELVAAEPRDRIAGTQARLEAPRHGDQQLVADQVTKAVVDDLEAIEVEIEGGKQLGGAALLEVLETAAESFHEHRAVSQPRQRIEEAGAVGPL